MCIRDRNISNITHITNNYIAMLSKLPGNRYFGAPFPNLAQPGRVLLVSVVVDHLVDSNDFVRFCFSIVSDFKVVKTLMAKGLTILDA